MPERIQTNRPLAPFNFPAHGQTSPLYVERTPDAQPFKKGGIRISENKLCFESHTGVRARTSYSENLTLTISDQRHNFSHVTFVDFLPEKRNSYQLTKVLRDGKMGYDVVKTREFLIRAFMGLSKLLEAADNEEFKIAPILVGRRICEWQISP